LAAPSLTNRTARDNFRDSWDRFAYLATKMPELTEWTFAADAAKWITIWLHGRTSMPFTEAKVEQRGSGSLKRRDLSLLDRDGRTALTGEIRFPDAKDGQTPYNAKLVTDARRKAARAGARWRAFLLHLEHQSVGALAYERRT
jgi:hypothetical protein